MDKKNYTFYDGFDYMITDMIDQLRHPIDETREEVPLSEKIIGGSASLATMLFCTYMLFVGVPSMVNKQREAMNMKKSEALYQRQPLVSQLDRWVEENN